MTSAPARRRLASTSTKLFSAGTEIPPATLVNDDEPTLTTIRAAEAIDERDPPADRTVSPCEPILLGRTTFSVELRLNDGSLAVLGVR